MPRRPPDRPFATPRSRPWLPTWRAMLAGLIAAATAVLALVPVSVLAQDADGAAAWWVGLNEVDATTECGAQAAWVRAMDAEDQAEHDLTTDPLPAVLGGPELARESNVVGRLEEQERGLARIEFQKWRVMGGSDDELVLYMSYTGRLGFWDAESAHVAENQWVESGQAAYRVVRHDGTWRVTDRQVFDQTHHTIDPAALDEVGQAYVQRWEQLTEAYNGRDLAGLDTSLSGHALDVYRKRLQTSLDQEATDQLPDQGTAYTIDVHDGTALVYFISTPPSADTVEVIHRLVIEDGQWKISDVLDSTVQTDPDGTVHVNGCSTTTDTRQ